jgi:predicted RNase H-like HicB family nuclease
MKWFFQKAPRYNYYVVENSFVARIKQKAPFIQPERLTEDGQWVAYDDVWDVCTNGRHVKSEADALAEFQEILELRKGDTSE